MNTPLCSTLFRSFIQLLVKEKCYKIIYKTTEKIEDMIIKHFLPITIKIHPCKDENKLNIL